MIVLKLTEEELKILDRARDEDNPYDDTNGDFRSGHVGEKLISQFMTQRGWTVLSVSTIEDDNLKSYDVEFINEKNETTKVEVKIDRYCIPKNKKINVPGVGVCTIPHGRDTGNIFAEIKCNGIPSGISTTESDYFFYMFLNLGEIWVIEPQKFRDLIKKNKDVWELSKKAGQRGRVMGFKVPRKDVEKDFHIIKFELEITNEPKSDKELMDRFNFEKNRPTYGQAHSIGKKLLFAEVTRRGLLTYDEIMEYNYFQKGTDS